MTPSAARAASSLLLLAVVMLAAPAPQAASPPPTPRDLAGGTPSAGLAARPAGRTTLQLTVTSDEGAGPRRLEALFELDTRAEGPEHVALLSATLGPDGGQPGDPVALGEDCRQAAGGSGTRLLAFAVPDGDDLSQLLPACVPEPLFGAATDLLAFLQVQAAALECGRLRAAGDSCELPGFTITWSRPGVAAARVSTPRVTVTLEATTAESSRLRWRPEPLELAILRSDTPAGGMLLQGIETLELELTVAPDGRLLSGRSLADTVDFTATPCRAQALPPPGAPAPEGPAFSGRFVRALRLQAR